MRTVYFSFDGATIDSESTEILRQNAQKLKENRSWSWSWSAIRQSRQRRLWADRRIEAVSERLRSLGVARNQIRRMPVGSEQSGKLKCDAEACGQIRRVKLVYERR